MLNLDRTRASTVVVLLLFISQSAAKTMAQESSQQATGQDPPASDQQAVGLAGDYVISPGDLVTIRVFQQADMSGDQRVTAQGFIRLLYLEEPVKAAGMTEWELADHIRQRLYDIMYTPPQVVVEVKERGKAQVGAQNVAFLFGSVARPGPFPVGSDTRLFELLMAAGGVSETAADFAYILRGAVWEKPAAGGTDGEGDSDNPQNAGLEPVNIRALLRGQTEYNTQIHPGDFIRIPEGGQIYVSGDVTTPGAFPLRTDMTMGQALTLAGGVKGTAKKDMKIIRTDRETRKLVEINVNRDELQKDLTKDELLQENDIVYVPASGPKKFGAWALESFARQAILLPLFFIRR